jgi:hypothetical protein
MCHPYVGLQLKILYFGHPILHYMLDINTF